MVHGRSIDRPARGRAVLVYFGCYLDIVENQVVALKVKLDPRRIAADFQFIGSGDVSQTGNRNLDFPFGDVLNGKVPLCVGHGPLVALGQQDDRGLDRRILCSYYCSGKAICLRKAREREISQQDERQQRFERNTTKMASHELGVSF